MTDKQVTKKTITPVIMARRLHDWWASLDREQRQEFVSELATGYCSLCYQSEDLGQCYCDPQYDE